MIPAIILTIVAIAVFLVVLNVRRNAKRREYVNRMRSASILIREKRLSQALTKDVPQETGRVHLILQIEFKMRKDEEEWLFDAEEPVTIGRNPHTNKICIRRETVSGDHCRIFMKGGQLYVEDLRSANGTFIRRGINKLPVNGVVPLKQKDMIIVGGIALQTKTFLFDAAYI